jgi:DNA replication and repair protein RecF
VIAAVRVALRDFRNHERAEVSLGPATTVLHGPNGAGKTNLLEALHFGLTGRSLRTANEREVVRHGAEVARVEVTTRAADGDHLLEAALERGGGKRYRVDGAAVSDPSGVPRPALGVFLPDRLDLAKGPPALRRAHLDRFVASAWPARRARGAYARALAQRNALLGRVRAGTADAAALDPWDAQLARCGVELMTDRRDASAALTAPFHAIAADLGLPAAAGVEYRPRSRAGEAGELAAELRERRASDLERGFTTHGPHRDELALTLARRPLRAYGSQGQQRLAVLALLLAERAVLAERGDPPMMLLDDVMSELDRDRRERLAELLGAGGQAVITATDVDQVPLASAGATDAVQVGPAPVAA